MVSLKETPNQDVSQLQVTEFAECFHFQALYGDSISVAAQTGKGLWLV